jgi:hypothetical protein
VFDHPPFSASMGCAGSFARRIVDPRTFHGFKGAAGEASGEAAFIVHCPDGPPTLRESFGFNRTELNRIEDGTGPCACIDLKRLVLLSSSARFRRGVG